MKQRFLDRGLTYLLIVIIVVAVGSLFYIIEHPVQEKFTECYLLGIEGKAMGYPGEFVLSGTKVISVGYEEGDYVRNIFEDKGRLILGIVNREQEEIAYEVAVKIDGESAPVWREGEWRESIGPIILEHEEKWEEEIGFAPESVGDNQKVEFVLYKDGVPYFEEPPRLWVDVRGGE